MHLRSVERKGNGMMNAQETLVGTAPPAAQPRADPISRMVTETLHRSVCLGNG